MGCASFGVTQVLVGLHRVGVVGLDDALKRAEASGLEDREAKIDLMVEELKSDNFMPPGQTAAFRRALWREYLRRRNEDFSDYLSEAEVTVASVRVAETSWCRLL